MWAKYLLIILIPFVIGSCTNQYTKCMDNCRNTTYFCYLVIADTPTGSTSAVNLLAGFLMCQFIQTDCERSCGKSSSSTSSTRSSSSSSGSRSSSGGSSSGGGSSGSGGSSHEIITDL
ncbi:MAG: hypothetical protein KBA66_19310 [Leptospiraceae bacterium]|nr:hypothetical protein [Leptospiraceae bacterium]